MMILFLLVFSVGLLSTALTWATPSWLLLSAKSSVSTSFFPLLFFFFISSSSLSFSSWCLFSSCSLSCLLQKFFFRTNIRSIYFCKAAIKLLKITCRCIPLESPSAEGLHVLCLPHTVHHTHPHPSPAYAAFLFQSVPSVMPLITYKQILSTANIHLLL